MHIPIWNFYNSGDSVELVESNRKMHQSLLDAGASPITTEYPYKWHDCWNLAYRCAGMYNWLLEQSCSKNARQPQRFELLSAEQMLATWESYGANQWEVTKDGALAHKNPLPEQPGYLVSKKAHDACEFHFEVFLKSKASECQLGLFESVNNDVMSGYMLKILLADSGTCDLMHSKNGWIASMNPAAQRQLQAGGWNDIRVHFGNGRISVRLNGWKALDAPVRESDDNPLRVAIVSPDTKPGVKWRNVRVRIPD